MKIPGMRLAITVAAAAGTILQTRAFSPHLATRSKNIHGGQPSLRLGWRDDAQDSNTWKSVDGDGKSSEDWQELLRKKKNGSFWSDFEPSVDDDEQDTEVTSASSTAVLFDETETWLDTLASIQAEEVEFNLREADRADKVRQMQEWGFESRTIASALDVAVEEQNEEVRGMQDYREASYLDIEDLTVIESHTKVPKDPETNEPIRSQAVYVDEHACIGCTNCATLAQSTFFMEPENGRARVFEQWGDDDNTIQMAIETCPVDCIYYVPYEELVQLEVSRRDQSINVLAGLVSRAERGAGSGVTTSLSARSFGNKVYTDAPKISGNAGTRCNNCPSNGCRACPMYGIGQNPVFESKEKLRLQKAARRQLEEERRRDNKIADL